MKYLIIILLFIQTSWAEDKLFYPYKNIYYLFESRAIFQFSFRLKMIDSEKNESENKGLQGLFFGYTQLSFWKQGKVGNDNPYIYSNYNPEIHYIYDLTNKTLGMTGIQIGAEHQSDGLGKQFDSIHHEWNRIDFIPIFNFFDNALNVRAKFWYADITPQYNPDIENYLGFCQISFATSILKNYWQPRTELTVWKGNGFKTDNISFRLENSIRIPTEVLHFKSPLALFIQWYNGYGESLQTYNRKTNNLRFGINFTF